MQKLALAVLALGPSALAAQTVSVAASRWLTDPHVTDYRVSLASYRAGPIIFLPFAQLALQGPRDSGAALGGAGGDLVLRLTTDARPYLVGGVSGGFLDFRGSVGVGLWSAWSVGVGAELLRLGGVGVGVEGRLQRLSRDATGGISLGVRLGSALGRGQAAAVPVLPLDRGPAAAAPGRPALASVDHAGSGAARTVMDAALEAMGTPYRWGGSDANGFDCSGLIQYAYARASLAVPRRSADQAKFGQQIPADLAMLAPGDILVFAARPGGTVEHVGLYLGDSRFIHSATGGTRISRLAPDDATGRWWFDRWLEARRILE